MMPEAVRDGTKAWCGYAAVASELLEVSADARPLPASGCGCRVVLEPSVGGHLGGGPSGSGEFAEVVAGEVEGPLDLGFDLAAQP